MPYIQQLDHGYEKKIFVKQVSRRHGMQYNTLLPAQRKRIIQGQMLMLASSANQLADPSLSNVV